MLHTIVYTVKGIRNEVLFEGNFEQVTRFVEIMTENFGTFEVVTIFSQTKKS